MRNFLFAELSVLCCGRAGRPRFGSGRRDRDRAVEVSLATIATARDLRVNSDISEIRVHIIYFCCMYNLFLLI